MALRRMRLTPKMKYSTAPTSGTSQTNPTHAMAARESLLRRIAWPEAHTESTNANAATPICQTSPAKCHAFGAETIGSGDTLVREEREGRTGENPKSEARKPREL